MLLADAVAGFVLDMRARRLAAGTVSDYTNTLRKWQTYCGANRDLSDITADDLRAFLGSLNEIGKKQLLNHHIGLSAFYTWAVRCGHVAVHPLRAVPRPKPERRAIQAFSKDEITRLLSSAAESQLPKRNRAILLLLLDCGLRASELCDLQMRHYDAVNGRILAYGKGDKERSLPISETTRAALKSYVLAARKHTAPHDPLFVSRDGAAMTRGGLLQLLYALGERADVPDCHPHRFRHTFAIQYLRNGGDVYSLQMSLGHESLEMCRRYLALASADLAAVHRRASPVSAWAL